MRYITIPKLLNRLDKRYLEDNDYSSSLKRAINEDSIAKGNINPPRLWLLLCSMGYKFV